MYQRINCDRVVFVKCIETRAGNGKMLVNALFHLAFAVSRGTLIYDALIISLSLLAVPARRFSRVTSPARYGEFIALSCFLLKIFTRLVYGYLS